MAVSIGYRLAVWGFLQSSELSDAGQTNIGLRDQRLALHWINENIKAFGGDKDKVTIWGESAGAASVGWHITAYNGRDDGLFRAGIMESGNVVNYGGQVNPSVEGIELVSKLSLCPHCLRPMLTILRFQVLQHLLLSAEV